MNFFEQIKFIKYYSGYSKNKYILFFIYSLFSAFVQVSVNFTIMYLIDFTIENKSERNIIIILFITLNIANVILIYFLKRKILKISFKSEKNIFQHLGKEIFINQISTIKSATKGEMNALLMNRIREYRMFLINHFENIFYRPIVFVFSVIVSLILNYKISIVIIFFIILTSIFNIYISQKVTNLSKKYYNFQGDFYKYQKEIIDQYNTIILTGMKNTILKRYLKETQIVQHAEEDLIKRNNIAYIPALLNEYLPTLLYMMIIILNIDNGNLSYGKAISLMTIISTISLPLTHTLRSFVILKKNTPFMEDVNRIISSKDKINIKFYDELEDKCLIKIENLFFSYDNNKQLNIPNVKIYSNDKIAIIGDTGSGKTTFFKLILGLINFEKGKINISSHNKFNDIRGFWDNISYLDNNTYIFDGSLHYNITFNEEQETIKEKERYYKILDKLNIRNLENQYIYQDGRNLSGGQKMKICLARALYKDAEIFLLDEPMSSLDKDSEQDIIDILKNLEKTILVITHRKDILEICNRIFYVEGGVMYEKNR